MEESAKMKLLDVKDILTDMTNGIHTLDMIGACSEDESKFPAELIPQTIDFVARSLQSKIDELSDIVDVVTKMM